MRSTLVVYGLVAVIGALTAGAFVFGGELASFMLASLEALPFLVLAMLAQAGERRAWARVLTYLWLAGMVVGFAVLVLVLAVAAVGVAGPALVAVLLAILASLLVAVSTLFRPIRVAIAMVIPISPDSLVHKVALFILTYVTLASLGQLAGLGGNPPLLAAAPIVQESASSRSSTGQILDLFYGLAWILPTTVVAAGFPLKRTFVGSLHRLGFTRPTGRQVLIGLGLSVVLVGLFTGVDKAIGYFWNLLGWPTTNTEAFTQLLGAGFSPIGAVAVGITAGIGEEAATRGLLQPRLGKLLPALVFVSLHAFQYSTDALLSVFLMGLILAFIRDWSSTTIAALVHGTYDFLAIILEVLGLGI